MLCPNCGKELPEDAVICESCGAPSDTVQAPPEGSGLNEQADTGTPDIYADYPQTPSEPQKPRKKKLFLKITAIIAAAVILLAGVAVLGYYTFLPAKLTLKTAQYFTLKKAWKQTDQYMTLQEKKLDAVYNTPVKTDTKVSIKMDTGFLTALGLDEGSAELFVDFLDDFTFQAVTEADLPNRKENFDLRLNYLNNPMLSLNGFLDNDRMGVSLPELSQKRVVGSFRDIPRLIELYPEELSSSRVEALAALDPWLASRIRQETGFDRKDLKQLMDTYGMFLVNNVDSSNMSIRRNKATRLFDEEVRCQEVTITLDQKAQMDLVGSLLDTMRKDDLLYDAVFSKGAKILEIMVNSNPALAESLQGVNIASVFDKSQIRLLLSTLKLSLTKDMFFEEVVIKVYIEGLDVVKYEMEIPTDTPGGRCLFSYESLINDNASRDRYIFDIASDGLSLYLGIDRQYDPKSDTKDLTFEINMSSARSDPGNFRITFKSNQDPDGPNRIKGRIDAVIDLQAEDNVINISFGADMKQVRNKDGLPENTEMIADLSTRYPPNLPEPLVITLVLESDFQYGVTVETPDWSADAIDLATASKEELDAFVTEIMETINSITQLLEYMY